MCRRIPAQSVANAADSNGRTPVEGLVVLAFTQRIVTQWEPSKRTLSPSGRSAACAGYATARSHVPMLRPKFAASSKLILNSGPRVATRRKVCPSWVAVTGVPGSKPRVPVSFFKVRDGRCMCVREFLRTEPVTLQRSARPAPAASCLVGSLVTLQDGLGVLPPAQRAEIDEWHVLEIRRKLPPQAVPAEPRAWFKLELAEPGLGALRSTVLTPRRHSRS